MEQRNIVFICLDTVRKDYFDKFSKRIKRLSDIDFDEAYAASSWSVPSHGTMLTGQLPSDHGVHTHNLDFGSINQTVLDELEGYQRIGVSANGYANSNFNFDGYFDEFFEVYSGMDNLAGLNVRDFVNDLDDDLSITSYISFLKATLGHEQTIASLRNGALKRYLMNA